MKDDELRCLFSDKNIYLSMTKDGLVCLEDLLEKKKKIDTVITLPKEKSGNVSDYADFTGLCKEFGIKLYNIEKINSLLPIFQRFKPNAIIVNGWSQLLSLPLIKTTKSGTVGLHPALLPKNRGRAPIAWHFINQEKYGGVTLFYLDKGCDSGPIIDQKCFRILKKDNASSFYQKMTVLASELLIKHFDEIVSGNAKASKQDETKATYLLARRPKDSRIDFNNTAISIHNLIRAVTEVYPLASFSYNKKTFYTMDSEILINSPKFSGFPGQIAKATHESLWVLTRNKVIEIKKIINSDKKPIEAINQFKVGAILNE